VKNVKHPAVLEGSEDDLAGSRPGNEPAGEENSLCLEVPHDALGRTGSAEGVEHQLHRPVDLFVRIEDDPVLAIVDQSYRRPYPQLTPTGLVQLPPEQPSA